MKTRDTLLINNLGHLEIGGVDTVRLVEEYGTPLYVMDEAYIRKVCESYTAILKKDYPNSLVCYASKAFSCTAIYKIVSSMGLGADVVSAGELATALASGIDMSRIYFHGNAKTNYELQLAVASGVHCIVIDNASEAQTLSDIALKAGIRQKVLIRVNPGIDAHTHQFIQTSRVDSKFGFGISDGAAIGAIKRILQLDGLEFIGIHCHIGSQIFELKPFELAVEKMTDFIVKIKSETGAEVTELNMGGGYGVTYTAEDRPLEPSVYVSAIVNKLKECIANKKISAPKLIFEPGRSIVGEAGITLYTVVGVKNIKDVKTYVSVDGGMFENPRYALYQSKYEAVLASNAACKPTQTVTVAGKCCESGDMLVADALLPEVNRGDILAVLTTGAYNYSMASNYNRNVVPPVVLVNKGKSGYIVKPQTYEDLLSRDVSTDWLEEK